MEIKGVDISYCQEGIDYNKLKTEGVKFAIIRAGFSETEDKVLKKHIDGLRKVGIPFGLYWYSYAGLRRAGNGYELISADRNYLVEEAKKEAKAFLSVIKKYGLVNSLAYPAYYDIEEAAHLKAGKRALTNMAIAFCDTLQSAGVLSGLYLNPNFLECGVYKAELVDRYDIWLAHWTHNPSVPSGRKYGQKVWQWGVTRIGGMEVDGDLCFIDYPARIREWRNTNGQTAPQNPAPATKKTVDGLAREVINGEWGNGDDRKKRLTAAGYDYKAVQNKVNEILYSPKKSVDALAKEVIAGKWGNGDDRKKRLTDAGYDYYAVQAKVNQLLRK